MLSDARLVPPVSFYTESIASSKKESDIAVFVSLLIPAVQQATYISVRRTMSCLVFAVRLKNAAKYLHETSFTRCLSFKILLRT